MARGGILLSSKAQNEVQLTQEQGLDCSWAMLSGIPAEEIVKYAQENQVDLIVEGPAS